MAAKEDYLWEHSTSDKRGFTDLKDSIVLVCFTAQLNSVRKLKISKDVAPSYYYRDGHVCNDSNIVDALYKALVFLPQVFFEIATIIHSNHLIISLLSLPYLTRTYFSTSLSYFCKYAF